MTHGKSRRAGCRGAVCLLVPCLAGILVLFFFSACNGISDSADISGALYDDESSSSSSSTNSTDKDFVSATGSGSTDIILRFFKDGPRPGTGPAAGTTTVVFTAADIGLPSGGSVALSITGGGLDWSDEARAGTDGKVCFQIPRMASGTEVMVSMEVKDSDGNVVSSGSETQTVEGDGSEIHAPASVFSEPGAVMPASGT